MHTHFGSSNLKKNKKNSQGGCPTPANVPKLGVSGVKDTAKTNKDLGMSCYTQVDDSVFFAGSPFLTLSDPCYFRQLTIRGGGGALKASPPPTISKTVGSIFTISYMCILPGVLGMFQLEFFKNSRFWPFYSDFKIKSSENSCKNNIIVILFKIDFKYTKRRRILMRI